MSDVASATLLAAGITAFVSALVFLAGEIIKLVQSKKDRRAKAIDEVLDALANIVAGATLPKIVLIYSSRPIRYMNAALRLFPILPKRDMIVVDWLLAHAQRLSQAKDGNETGKLVGEAQATLMLWMRKPKPGRRTMANDMKDRGIESPVATVMKK